MHDELRVIDGVVCCKTDTWEYRLGCIRVDTDQGIIGETGVRDWVDSGLVLM